MSTNPANIATDQRPPRLLGVWAHPDDEAYLAAGLMARHIRQGGEVTSVSLTLGELGFPADDTRSRVERERLRHRELTNALATVGVHDVRTMEFPDGGIADVEPEFVVAAIASVIDDVQPDLIVTFGPDGITGHPDHVATSSATTAAWERCAQGRLLYATHEAPFLRRFSELHRQLGVYVGDEPTGTPAEDIVMRVDLSGDDLDLKRRALAAHASQTAGLAAAMGEETYRAWIAGETFRAPHPAHLHQLTLAA